MYQQREKEDSKKITKAHNVIRKKAPQTLKDDPFAHLHNGLLQRQGKARINDFAAQPFLPELTTIQRVDDKGKDKDKNEDKTNPTSENLDNIQSSLELLGMIPSLGILAKTTKNVVDDVVNLSKATGSTKTQDVVSKHTPLRHKIANLSPSDKALVESAETFKAHGVSNSDALNFIQNTPEGQSFFDIALKAAGPEADLDVVIRRVLGYIKTGVDLPTLKEIDKPLVKIVPTGGNLSAYSPFFTTQKQLDLAKKSGKPLSDVFGLPAISDSARYGIFEITPLKTASVFESLVAPTSELGAKLTTKGGGVQYIVPDRTQFSSPKFVEVIDDNL